MKTFNEKEKKLQDALNKLSNIDIQKINNLNSSDQKSMEEQKNQLQIEKIEIENKYNELEHKRDIDFLIKRNDDILRFAIPNLFLPLIKSIEPLSPASRAGLLPGDFILSVNGISIFTFTADGTTNTVGHGLGVKPDVVMIRRRSDASGPGMILLTDLINGSQDYGYMHIADNFDDIGYAVHTSSLVEYNDTNATTQVGYAFTQIQGFSKFGQYTGNGHTAAEGPFVYCGFKPAWIMIKNTDTDARNWYMYDNARRTFNPNGLKIYADTADQEATDQSIDLYSTGFRVRPGDLGSYGTSSTNHSGQQMFYMAFAESPFVSSEGVPTTAY